jgi:Conjugative transposon protein TcpC
MARKATLDRGLRPDELAADEFAADGAVPDGVAVDGTLPARPARLRRPQRQGAGGRWLVWTGRAVIWAVLIIVGFRGVESIVASVRQPGTGPAGGGAGTASSGFPTTLGEAFALQFGDVYLNFSPATAGQRAADLTPFIPVGSAPQFGWNGAGSQQLVSEQVASVSVSSAQQATVTLLARVSTGLIELGVPVYYAQGGLVVSAEPALLPAPDRASPPPAPRTASDPAARAALTSQLAGFFRAYASGDQQALARFLVPGASVTGLGGAVNFGAVTGMEVPAGGATRRIAVSVTWDLPAPPAAQSPQRPAGRGRLRQSQSSAPAPGLQMTYQMTVVRQRGAWYVQAIGPSAQQPGGP